ncbi:MAG: TonB family protein [Opitutus sp.]
MLPRLLLLLALSCGYSFLAAAPPKDPLNPNPDVDEIVFLKKWARAEYPRDAAKEKVGGVVKVSFIANETGVVISARALEEPDPRLAAAAVAAVKQWEIEPVIEDGHPVSCCLTAEIKFTPGEKVSDDALRSAQLPHPAPITAASPLETPEGDYPDVMRGRRLSGKVLFKGTVTETGSVVASTIIDASHADFVLPALASLRKWKFTPRMQGDLPLPSDVEGVVTFTSEITSPSEVLEANGISTLDGSAPELPANILIACETAWPLDLILAGVDGRVSVDFTIMPDGRAKDIVVVSATHHDLGLALVAAMERWYFVFQPDALGALSPGVRITALKETRLRRTVEFTIPTETGDAQTRELARLVTALRDGTIQGAKGLDQKLTPIYRAMPHYPGAFVGREAPAGQAVIDLIVDREGRVRLPRIVSASQPEFGWAAATAALQWVFKAPRRAGEPTEVKVRIPFEFKPVLE